MPFKRTPNKNMAWNKSYLFVKAPEVNDIKEILSKLNLLHDKLKKEVPLHYSNKPETLVMGIYNGTLLIVHPDLALHFYIQKKLKDYIRREIKKRSWNYGNLSNKES